MYFRPFIGGPNKKNLHFYLQPEPTWDTWNLWVCPLFWVPSKMKVKIPIKTRAFCGFQVFLELPLQKHSTDHLYNIIKGNHEPFCSLLHTHIHTLLSHRPHTKPTNIATARAKTPRILVFQWGPQGIVGRWNPKLSEKLGTPTEWQCQAVAHRFCDVALSKPREFSGPEHNYPLDPFVDEKVWKLDGN